MRQDHQPSSARHRVAATLAGHDDAAVHALLESLSAAVTTGNGEGAAECWAVPALVIGDTDEVAVQSLQQVADFFAGAREQYNARGVGDTRPQVQWLEWITDAIALVEVRWPWLDAKGDEVGEETSTYLLKCDETGEPKLRVAIMHGASQRPPRVS